MYKTIWQMWCDREVAENPYRWGNLKSLHTLIASQDYSSQVFGLLGNEPISDLSRYASYNLHRLASPSHNRAALFLPPLTQEDIDESTADWRILGEDPFWMHALKEGTLSYIKLWLRTRDWVRMGIINEEAIVN